MASKARRRSRSRYPWPSPRWALPRWRLLGSARSGSRIRSRCGRRGRWIFFNKKKGVEIERNMILLRLQKQIGELKRWSDVRNKFNSFCQVLLRTKLGSLSKGETPWVEIFFQLIRGPPTIPNMANLGHPTRLFFWAGWVTVSVAKKHW